MQGRNKGTDETREGSASQVLGTARLTDPQSTQRSADPLGRDLLRGSMLSITDSKVPAKNERVNSPVRGRGPLPARSTVLEYSSAVWGMLEPGIDSIFHRSMFQQSLPDSFLNTCVVIFLVNDFIQACKQQRNH